MVCWNLVLVLKFLLNYTIDRIGNVLTNWIFKVSILHSRSIDSELKKIRCFNCILFDETNYISRCQALCKCYKFNCCMGSSLSIGISLSLIAKNKDKLNIFKMDYNGTRILRYQWIIGFLT